MNRIIETPAGFDCIVNGQQFGTWRSRAEAHGGMQVEVRRAEKADADKQGMTRVEQIASGRWVVRCWRGSIIETHDERYEAERALRRMRGS